MKQHIWTVRDLMERTTTYFEQKGLPEPRINCEWLLAHTLSLKRFDLYVNHDRPLNATELAVFKSLIQRRVKREPLQYIVGSVEFMGLPFTVRTGVLIPRPETELLVEAALSICESRSKPIKILDIGIGSGCIGISMAYYLRSKQIPATVTGLDISKEAVELSRLNAEQIVSDCDVTLVEGDVNLVRSVSKLGGPFDLILSNPPYIPTGELGDLEPEVRSFEPVEALDGGTTGLDFYKRIVSLAPDWLVEDRNSVVILESGYRQAPEIESMLVERGFAVKKIKDYNFVDRVIIGSLFRS